MLYCHKPNMDSKTKQKKTTCHLKMFMVLLFWFWGKNWGYFRDGHVCIETVMDIKF